MSSINKKDIEDIIMPRIECTIQGSLEQKRLQYILNELYGLFDHLEEDEKNERHLADAYMEYVKAITNINNQQERIQSIVNKAVENGLKISDVSDHFVYKKGSGLFYRNSEQSSYFAVQEKQDPPSFSEAMDELLKQDYSYQDIGHLFVQLTNDATGFLKNLPKLEDTINNYMDNYFAFSEQFYEVLSEKSNDLKNEEDVKSISFKEYLLKLEDAFKKNGIQRCYCSDNFKDDITNHLYIVSLPETKFSKEFYDLLSEKSNSYKISILPDRNVDMDWYMLYTKDQGRLNYGNIDFSNDKEELNENDSIDKIDKSECDEYEL